MPRSTSDTNGELSKTSRIAVAASRALALVAPESLPTSTISGVSLRSNFSASRTVARDDSDAGS